MSIDRLRDVHVILVHPEIAWNTGNVGRTVVALGARLHLVEPLGFSLDDRRVKRAGLDYWEHVEPTVWPTWSELRRHLLGLGRPRVLTAEAERPFWQADLTGPTALLFGSETAGLPLALRSGIELEAYRIPMTHTPVRSLNVSTTVGMALYEVLRQRSLGGRGE